MKYFSEKAIQAIQENAKQEQEIVNLSKCLPMSAEMINEMIKGYVSDGGSFSDAVNILKARGVLKYNTRNGENVEWLINWLPISDEFWKEIGIFMLEPKYVFVVGYALLQGMSKSKAVNMLNYYTLPKEYRNNVVKNIFIEIMERVWEETLEKRKNSAII